MTEHATRNPVGWFEIYVEDMPRAKAFYEAVLGRKLQQLWADQKMNGFEMWAFEGIMNGAGASGALVKMHGVASGHNSVLIYFSCEDCAVEASRVEENGGKIEKPKFAIGEYGFISLVYDTEGNMIGLHSLK